MTHLFHHSGRSDGAESGAMFQGYVLCECLRSSPAEDVYRARQISTGRPVLLKMLSAGLALNPERLQACLADARSAMSLKHDAIVPVLDVGVHEDRLYYMADFMGGGSALDALQQRGALKEKHAILLAQGVALGLQHAWEKARLFHGHLRPENILLGVDGAVHIADLGLGRVFSIGRDGATGPASATLPLLPGVAHYASPEQARGASDIDFRSDIYSLGAVLYHMVTGVRPFDCESDEKALNAHLFSKLPDPQLLRSHLSPGIAWLIEKMMIRDRDRRPASWSEVLADLMEVVHGASPYGNKPGPEDSTVGRTTARETQMALVPPNKHVPRRQPRARIVLPMSARNRGCSFRQDNRIPPATTIAIVLIAVATVAFVYVRWISPPTPVPIGVADQFIEEIPRRSVQPRNPESEPEGDLAASPEEAARFLQESVAEYHEAKIPIEPRSGEPSLDPSGIKERPARPEGFRYHALFIKGARNFNAALALFRLFENDHTRVQDLRQVDQLSEQAAVDFEALRAIYPRDYRAISKYVDQSHGMTRYARQSLLQSGANLSDGTPPSKQPKPPGLRSRPSRPVERSLSLAQEWRGTGLPADKAAEEIYELLSTRGQPRVDLTPKPSIALLGQIPYLSRADEIAGQMFRRKLPEAQGLQNPAFPQNSVRISEVRGTFEDRFSLLQFLMDREGQIVGLQMIDESESDKVWLPPAMFSEKWRVFDLLMSRSVTVPTALVAHRVRSDGGMVRIDTEMALPGEPGSGRMGRSLIRSSLLLPQPMVDLMLIRLRGSR